MKLLQRSSDTSRAEGDGGGGYGSQDLRSENCVAPALISRGSGISRRGEGAGVGGECYDHTVHGRSPEDNRPSTQFIAGTGGGGCKSLSFIAVVCNTVGLRIPALPERSTAGFHRPGGISGCGYTGVIIIVIFYYHLFTFTLSDLLDKVMPWSRGVLPSSPPGTCLPYYRA